MNLGGFLTKFLGVLFLFLLAACGKAVQEPAAVVRSTPIDLENTATVETLTSTPTTTATSPIYPTPSSIPTELVIQGFWLASPVFEDGGQIPKLYTCHGFSPPLVWSNPPQGTQSFALLMEERLSLGGTYTHWLSYNLPGDFRDLPEDAYGGVALVEPGSFPGLNDRNLLGYDGPCPEDGDEHSFLFILFAVDVAQLDLDFGVPKEEFLLALEGHILGVATYSGVIGE